MNMKKTSRGWMHRLKDIESLYLRPEKPDKTTVEYFPYIYIEAGIDFNDVRTGYRGAEKLARALKIFSGHAFAGWSAEIVQDANIGRIRASRPRASRLHPLPEFVDAEFIDTVKSRYIEHLTRTWKKLLYRSSDLNIYSGAGESREEFVVRCGEQFLAQMREELDQLRIIFNRKQEQLKEKYLGIDEVELPDSAAILPEENDRNIYSRYAERIAAMFLNANFDSAAAETDIPRMDKTSELEERLIALTAEARRKIALLHESYDKRAERIDEYVLRLNLKNIHCERSCILWMPLRAE
jgi:hypothetical protein